MPRSIDTTLVLLLILLTFEVEAFGRPRSHKHKRKSVQTRNDCDPGASEIIKNAPTDNDETVPIDVDPYSNCGLVGFGVVQKIPYQSATSATSPVNVNFSSGCVRCGMCLAIVEKVNQTLIEAHDLMPPNQWLDGEEIDFFLRTVCNKEFRHYALREIDGERYIGDGLSGATIVASNADGHWDTKEKCHGILDDAGTRQLYRYWREWCNGAAIDLFEILCRSDSGSLRDCRSIDGGASKPELCQSFYHAGVKVTAELSSN